MEYLEDLIEKDPSEAYPKQEVQDGTFLPQTGDAVADSWFKDIAEGKVPDFLRDFDSDGRNVIAGLLKPKSKTDSDPVVVKDEFHDDYTKGLADD